MTEIKTFRIRTNNKEVVTLNEVENIFLGKQCVGPQWDSSVDSIISFRGPRGEMTFKLSEIEKLEFLILSENVEIIVDTVCCKETKKK